ncbi:MAG TPA: hypothetical protein VF379_08550 [Gaiellaceae bacterium]
MPRALWVKAPLALLRHRVGLLAVVSAAFLVAMGAAAGPLMKAGAESEALQSKLKQLTPLAAGLVIDRPPAPDTGDLGTADARRRAAARALGRTLPYASRPIFTTTSYAQLAGRLFDLGNPLLVVVMARDGAKAHVHVVAGGGAGVWLSSAVAGPGRVRAGGDVSFVRPLPAAPGIHRLTLLVGAVYRQLDADLANPYWVNFTAKIRARNPDAGLPPTFALASRSDLYRLAHVAGDDSLANVYEYPVDTRSMTPARAKQIANAYRRITRAIAVSSPLAAGLGCSDPRRPCRVSSELSDAVRLAAAGNAGLGPVIDLLAGFCVLVALGAGLVAGVFTGRRRAAEARLSLVGGEPAVAFFVRAGIEALVPAAVGSAVGLAIALELLRLFTPRGSVDASVVSETGMRVGLSVIATVLVVGIGSTLARGRLGTVRASGRNVLRVPWELAAAAAAAAAWIVLSSGGGLVKDPVVGSHPRLAVLLLPALVAAPLTGLAARLFRTISMRRASAAGIVPFLALRRVAAARGLVVALLVTVAAGVASLAFAQILQSSLAANAIEKALVSNGSDVQGVIDPARDVPRSFPYPATKVAEAFSAGRLASGQPFEVIVVDPSSLARVLAGRWPRDVRSAVQALATSRARLPAVAVGIRRGSQALTIGASQVTVDVVARVRAFPGMQPSQPLLVIPFGALGSWPMQALTYVWATGPPRQVAAALARSSLSPSYVTFLADFSRNPDVANITRTYGFLRIVAAGIVLLALVALMLYLNGRGRSQLVASAFLRRMGISQRTQALSVALEAGLLVTIATVTGLLAALATAGGIVGHVDPLAEYSPAPVAAVPWALVLVSGLGAIVVAGAVGVILTLIVRRSDVGEALRVD